MVCFFFSFWAFWFLNFKVKVINFFGGVCGREVFFTNIPILSLKIKPAIPSVLSLEGFYFFCLHMDFLNYFLVFFFIVDCTAEQIFTLKHQDNANVFFELFC